MSVKNGAAAKLKHLGKLAKPNLYQTMSPLALPSWQGLDAAEESALLKLKDIKQNGTLTIVGAGITGLTTAWLVRKSRPDVRIRILDNRNRVGGWMETTHHSFGWFESGPRTLMPGHVGTTVLLSILRSINKLELVGGLPSSSEVNKKAVFYKGRPQLVPYSLVSAIQFLFSPLMKGARLCGLQDFKVKNSELPKLGDDESVHDFISRRLGSVVGDRLISAVMRGIYAGDSRKLSARSVARLNNLYYLEKVDKTGLFKSVIKGNLSKMEKYPREALSLAFEAMTDSECAIKEDRLQKCSIFGFSKGIQPVAQIVADSLSEQGVEIMLNTPVKKLVHASDSVKIELEGSTLESDIVVSTVAKPELFSTKVASLLSQVQYNTLAVVNIYVPDPKVARNWFGILVPRSEDATNAERIIGVIFDSSVRKAVGVPAEGSNMTVMLGGDLWQETSEEEVKQHAVAGLKKMIGDFDTSQAVYNVRIQHGAIPQLNVGHDALQSKVHAAIGSEYGQRVALAGMAFGRGCGVSDCVVDALTLALRFAPERKLVDPGFFFQHYLHTIDPNLYV